MKRKALIAASIGVMALTLVGTVAFGGEHTLIRHEAADSYSLTVTPADVTVLSGAKSTVETSYGSLITFGHTNIGIDGSNFTLTEGTLFNYDDLEANLNGGALSGLTSITVDIVEGSLTLSYGWETGVWSEDTIALTDNVACDLSDLHPNYFKLSGSATFSTISVLYTCTRGEEPVDNTMTVYFRAPESWTNANLYCWGEGTDNWEKAWPGTAMTKDELTGLWYHTYDTTLYTNVIFNNGSEQSANLVSPTDENLDCYVWDNGWYNEDTTEMPPYVDPTAYDLFLIPNSNWKVDNARFAAYFFGTKGNTWVSLEDVDSDGIYECVKPNGYESVIFCRMNPGNQTNSWDTKWNQTEDLTIPTNGTNLYTVKDGTWDKGGGTWSTHVFG